jgi:type VI secretion system secreted protein Hcp
LGESQSGSHAAGGAGKVGMQDFRAVMEINKIWPQLMLACANGEHLKKGVLTCRKDGKDQQEYLKVIVSDLLVASYQTGSNSHSGIVPTDQLSLNFGKIEFEYREQKPDGTLGTPVKAGYDLKSNKQVLPHARRKWPRRPGPACAPLATRRVPVERGP